MAGTQRLVTSGLHPYSQVRLWPPLGLAPVPGLAPVLGMVPVPGLAPVPDPVPVPGPAVPVVWPVVCIPLP